MAEKGNPLIGKGLFMWLVLAEGASPGGPPATVLNLKSWIGRVPEPYTGTLDSVAPQLSVEDFFGVQRDHFVIVELSTMTVLDMLDSDPEGAIGEVQKLLGP